MLAGQADFFVRLAQGRVHRIVVGLVGLAAGQRNLAGMGGHIARPLRQQQRQFITHDQRQQHGSQRRLAVGKSFLDAVLRRPDRRVPETLAQGLRREFPGRYTGQVRVHTDHRNAAGIEGRQRRGEAGRRHGNARLTGHKKSRSGERLFRGPAVFMQLWRPAFP